MSISNYCFAVPIIQYPANNLTPTLSKGEGEKQMLHTFTIQNSTFSFLPSRLRVLAAPSPSTINTPCSIFDVTHHASSLKQITSPRPSPKAREKQMLPHIKPFNIQSSLFFLRASVS
jgi:hypothetical protein